MATLRRGESLSTREPGIEIDAGLPAGRHVFQLVVTDDGGLNSAPVQAIVEIQPIDVRDPRVPDIRPDVLDRVIDTPPPGPILTPIPQPQPRPTPIVQPIVQPQPAPVISPAAPVTPRRTPVQPARPIRRRKKT